MKPSYLYYVPFSKRATSKTEKDDVAAWERVEKRRNKEIRVTYSGEEGLAAGLSTNAKIYVSCHGQSEMVSSMTSRVTSDVANSFYSWNKHLEVTDGINSILVTDIAKNMIKDGLFNDIQGTLRIKLYFCDTTDKGKGKAKTLANAFLNELKKSDLQRNCNIRVDCYPNHLLWTPAKKKGEDDFHKYATKKSVIEKKSVRAKEIRCSLFNRDECAPELTTDDTKAIVDAYFKYKSSRVFGLSGLLGLNHYRTSMVSAKVISSIKDPRKSGAEKFNCAAELVKNHPNNYLSKLLAPFIASRLEENENKFRSIHTP